jgi:hypothetical protein
VEDWRHKLAREASEMEQALRATLALSSDEAVRVELERLATLPQFSGFTWLWAPAVAKRNRVMFRPLLLSLFDRSTIDGRGRAFDAWKGASGETLEALLAEVDAADDVELTRRLYSWRVLSRQDGHAWWREDLVRRFRAATTAAARHVALAKIDLGPWPGLDAETALALWSIDRAAARTFILSHLPWGAERKAWRGLLEASRLDDPEFHFELYRKIVDEKSWATDVLALPTSPEIARELERRHPALWNLTTAGPTFLALLERHGPAAVAYVRRHVDRVTPRWAGSGQREGKGLEDLLALASQRGWIDLWAALLRTSATRELFDAQVAALVRAKDRARLAVVPGRGREVHGAGWSFAQSHTLSDATASALYAKYPDLVRGPYRMHVTPSGSESFPKLARAAIAAADHDLVDFLASRIAAQPSLPAVNTPAIAVLVPHYEGMSEADFVRHAAAALSRMPAFAIWSYPQVVQHNALAHLLFERSTGRFLADAAAVRDLLESPEIHVQLLAFRILAQDDPRARELAARHVDLLQATLLRRLRSSSRKLAFAALGNAARHDEATARFLLGRMRDALALPEQRYPTEELVGLIGQVLHCWPALRGPREQPVIYGLAGGAP